MIQKTPRTLILGFAAAFLAVGVPYWVIPYHEVNLPHALLTPGLLIVFLAALMLCRYEVAPFRKVTWVTGAVAPVAVMLRVVVEGVQDPTSHNLWPFEVGIALFMGLGAALPGALAGVLLARLLGPRNGGALS